MKHLPVKEIESGDRMDQEQATRFLKSKEYMVSHQPNTTRLRGEAVELAVNISDSFSPDFRRYFVACEDSGEYDACFSIIRYLYQIWRVRMPKKTLSHNIEFTPSALTLTKSGDKFTGEHHDADQEHDQRHVRKGLFAQDSRNDQSTAGTGDRSQRYSTVWVSV